ncbi:MAG: PD-(D/E)XK nuclease family protein [Clostridia bacterium]|nr:PD-(D/E)XK nuclease family protein [Clostridia bacterium]
MLEFLLGRACSGKTQEIINRVAEASKNGKAVLIVPEQFSFETERAVIKVSGAVNENVTILSFAKMYDEILQSFGKGAAVCVSEFEKIILVKRALKAAEENLAVFAKYTNYNDFIVSLSDTIKDLKFAGVTSSELAVAAEQIGGSLGAKLKDIALVMSTYDALLENKYIDASDRLTKLYYELESLDYFKGKKVFFDSFSGFTGQQYKIIEKIFEQTKDVVFSFSCENPDNNSISVFYNTNYAVNHIKSLARSRGVTEITFAKRDKNFYANSAMVHLEEVMHTEKKKSNFEANDNIQIISCENKRDEAIAAANIILKQVRENQYRFKDFIVVARNAEDYASYISRQCAINNIACFMDKSVKLASTPLGVYIATLLELAKSFSAENVLKLLKLGLSNFTVNEISEIEDYTYVWDIKGSDWKNEWEMSVKGLKTSEDYDFDQEALKRINVLRQKVYTLINSFKEQFKGTTEQKAKAIYNHLIDNGVDKNLSKVCDEFEKENDSYYASVLKQSWDSTIMVLDSMCRALDANAESVIDFADAFNIAAQICEITNAPQMLDEITFGGADRIRPSKPKISIILGANQGVFPHHSKKNGILAASDKDKLSLCGIVLDDTIKSAVEENYLVYSMLCCPTDKTYILYSKNSAGGEKLEPSSFVSKVLDSFNDVSTKPFILSSAGEFVPQTPHSAFYEIGRLDEQGFADVNLSLANYKNYAEKIEKSLHNSDEYDFSISSDFTHKLFGKNIQIYATEFDTYHKCSLSYFLKHGLGAKKLEKADLNVLQRGTIAHYVLEKMVEKHRSDLGLLNPAQISAEVDALIHEYMSMVRGADILMTARFAYLLNKIAESVKEIVRHIANEFAQSKFVPKFCELTIGKKGNIPCIEYTLSDGSVASFGGKIDRVDVYNNNVRVVDYKTGKMTFTLSDTLVGLNMQMLLYLYAVIKNGGDLIKDPKPAGILYMPAKKSKNTKTLKMNGIILENEDVRTAMEKANEGKFVPKFKEGSENYVSEETFKLIFDKIDKLMVNMGDSIIEGNFCANATDGATVKACTYCDFASICRSRDKEHIEATNYSNNDVIEILKRGE